MRGLLVRRRFGVSLFLVCAAVVYACAEPPPMDDETQSATNKPAKPPSKNLDSTDASTPVDSGPVDTCTPPAGSKCSVAPQCGCAMNETCDITTEATGATSCVTAGSATLGRPCSQTGDCVAGLTCSYGACRPFCGTARSQCDVAGTALCVEVLDGNSKPLPGNNVCTIKCDPRNPSAVCGSNACLWFSSYYNPEKVTDCNYGGDVAAKQSCQGDSDCLPGLACFNHPKYGLECEKWCRVGQSPSDCASDENCIDVLTTSAPVIDGVKEGVCQRKK